MLTNLRAVMLFTLLLFLKIRLIQGYRLLQDIGWLRIILFTVFVVPFAIRYLSNPAYTLFAYGVLLSSIHFFRTDTHFLKVQHLPFLAIFWLEYAVLATPMLLYLCWLSAWFYALALLLFVILLPYLRVYITATQPLKLLWLPRLLHPQAFELQSGLRKNFPLVVFTLLLALVFVQYVYTVPVFLIFMTFHTAFYYLEMEGMSLPMLLAATPQQLLWKKIKFQLVYFWLFVSPLCILFLLFHSTYWFVLLYFMVSSSLAQLFPIFYKYAVFVPAQQPIYNGWIYATFCTILLFIILIPFFIPVGLFALWRYYRKATQQMAVYF